MNKYEVIVIGVSAGGFQALPKLLKPLNDGFPLPLIVVQHEAQDADDFLPQYLDKHTHLKVKKAEEKEVILPATVYIAPPGYHLLIEEEKTFSLSLDDPVNFARPSIDVLFETAAEVYGAKVIGIILTGANYDGAAGLKIIKEAGGFAIVQDPSDAHISSMPYAALRQTSVDKVLPIDLIGPYLNMLIEKS